MTPPQEKGVGAGQENVHIFSTGYGYISIDEYIYGDMEMSPIYTDIHIKTTPSKNDRGVRSEKEKVNRLVIVYRRRARSTKKSRHRPTKPNTYIR